MKNTLLPLEERASEKCTALRERNKKLIGVLVCFTIAGWFLLLTIRFGVVSVDKSKGFPLNDAEEDIVVEMNINEHGYTYKQKVIFSPSSNITTIYVPQHPGIDASTTMYHQQVGMQAILNHDKRFCELSSLTEGYESQGIIEGAKIAHNVDTTISHDNSAFLGLEIEVDHLLTQKETDALHSDIQGLCSGMQIYEVRYVPTDLSQEDFNSIPFDDDNLNNTSLMATEVKKDSVRVRRNADLVSECSQNKEKCTYNRTWGRTCRWLICGTIMDPANFPKCARVIKEMSDEIERSFAVHTSNALHIASARRRCTLCCEDASTFEACKCTDVIDKNSFDRCQLKNDCAFGITQSRSCADLWGNFYSRADFERAEHPRRHG